MGELSKTAVAAEQQFLDKALHFIAYFGLAWFGTVLEIPQGVVGRDPSVADALTNVLGGLAGVATGWLVVRLAGGKTLAPHPRG